MRDAWYTHDGFWDGVHVDEVIINVAVGRECCGSYCSLGGDARYSSTVCIIHHLQR